MTLKLGWVVLGGGDLRFAYFHNGHIYLVRTWNIWDTQSKVCVNFFVRVVSSEVDIDLR